MTSTGYGMGSGGYGAGGSRIPGERRKKFAAMAGNLYRSGAAAVNEIRETYNQSASVGEYDSGELAKITIPGSFPHVAIVSSGREQMVLFPSYAKKHIKNQDRQFDGPTGPSEASQMGIGQEDYWRQEWARHEDEKAVVDVDVRGWIYNPHRGPITRRNRMLIGLARQLSGIPAPQMQQAAEPDEDDAHLAYGVSHQNDRYDKEQQSIRQQAQEIERRGRYEEQAAEKGDYSEPPRRYDTEDEVGRSVRPVRSGHFTPPSVPGSPQLGPQRTNTASTTASAELSQAELAVANANLMARLAPFMTTPLVQIPITLFFYNESESQSRTVLTDDAGHFVIRAALDFVPTHVRVLASEQVSCVEPINFIDDTGVSLISDIDDTIKSSNIALGAKEIFRNTFIRELHDMTVDGVQEWYRKIHNMGVQFHYCSNSPWQLYPVLATFFKLAGLPPGSLHLKQYSGMLQGIFEPVAERKKGTLERIMKDFPERKFLLVGDSGEADLEVYTELAVANPGRVMGVFIRDVTTPEETKFFDSGYGSRSTRPDQRVPTIRLDETPDDGLRRVQTAPPTKKPEGPVMGDLIDLSEEAQPSPSSSASSLLGRKPVPPRPSKPMALRSTPAPPVTTTREPSGFQDSDTPPPLPRRPTAPHVQQQRSPKILPPPSHPLSQMQKSSEQNMGSSRNLSRVQTDSQFATSRNTLATPPPPPPPRRRGTPRSTSPQPGTAAAARRRAGGYTSDVESETPSSGQSTPGNYTSATNNGYGSSDPAVTRRVELWQRRLERAHDTLDQMGVQLYTWRKGDDVVAEALGLVKQAMRDMGLKPATGGPRRR